MPCMLFAYCASRGLKYEDSRNGNVWDGDRMSGEEWAFAQFRLKAATSRLHGEYIDPVTQLHAPHTINVRYSYSATAICVYRPGSEIPKTHKYRSISVPTKSFNNSLLIESVGSHAYRSALDIPCWFDCAKTLLLTVRARKQVLVLYFSNDSRQSSAEISQTILISRPTKVCSYQNQSRKCIFPVFSK